MIYLSDICDLYHDLFDLPAQSIRSRSWSIWITCPIYLIQIMIYLIYIPIHLICIMIHLIYPSDISDLDHNLSNLSDLVDLDHDLSNISARFIGSDLSLQSIKSRSWSTWYICPIYLNWSIGFNCLIYTMIHLIYLCNLLDLDHDLSDLSVRSIWSKS